MDCIKVWNQQRIRINPDNRYVCLNDMAGATGKKVHDWIRLKNTEEYFNKLSELSGIPVTSHSIGFGLICSMCGGNQEQGTWAHPEIAKVFGLWCLKSKNMRSNFLYVFGDQQRKVCKIGISFNPASRLKKIQSTYPWDLKIWYSIDLGEEAAAWEKRLHEQHKKQRLNGEWFDSVVFKDIESQINAERYSLLTAPA